MGRAKLWSWAETGPRLRVMFVRVERITQRSIDADWCSDSAHSWGMCCRRAETWGCMATPILSIKRERTLRTFIFVSHSRQSSRSWNSCVVPSERNWRATEERNKTFSEAVKERNLNGTSHSACSCYNETASTPGHSQLFNVAWQSFLAQCWKAGLAWGWG